MAHTNLVSGTVSTPINHQESLAGDRGQWPIGARTAHREVLRQLDGWCRSHGWPTGLNDWIAEEAVRRSW